VSNETTDLAVSAEAGGNLAVTALAEKLAGDFLVPAQSIINVLRTQIIAVPANQPPVTGGELFCVMSVMRQYGFNPMLKQLHAWRDGKGKLAIMVGYDGWVQYARQQPTYKGVSYEFGPIVNTPDGKGKKAWEWVALTIHDTRGDFKQCPVFLDEWYVPQRGQYPEPWQKQTKHRIHLKAFTSGIREFYGLGGVYDDIDAEVMGSQQLSSPGSATDDTAMEIAASLKAKSPDEVLGCGSCAESGMRSEMSSCLRCGMYVCDNCFNESSGMCEICTDKSLSDGKA
jgi:hypothetical protein